jgi:hypothetical protein
MNSVNAALRFNQLCPQGSIVEVELKLGRRLSAKTAGPAYVWGGLALVELQGNAAPFQVEFVRPVLELAPEAGHS